VLILEYKLRTNRAQQAATPEAIRATQFVRNKALRLWMDTRGTTQSDLQALCSQLAKDFPFAARREFHGPTGRRRLRLAGDCPLLQKLSGEEAGQKRLSSFPER
jgi:putative transposase